MADASESTTNGNNRDATVERLAALAETQSQQLIQHMQAAPAPKIDENAGERYRKLNPPIFYGTVELMKAEEWICTTENMSKYSRVLDVEKVNCDAFMLRAARQQKLNEFIQLRQGNMSVEEYIRKFEELSHFASHIVSTNEHKVERFIEGLRPDLYQDVKIVGTQGVTIATIAERALEAEQAESRIIG
ncbi:uncharacterized protein LOC111386539, partial [Olea europaea var. sylvestris]|uniref:uncharacterized protein LOC111386539 n=1 Tax=Olea europaea var. sylvestris TaxID=158386 RepID=UPI000C1D2211